MNRLGGRKFLGFIILAALAVVCAGREVDISANLVALLLGAYGVFAGSNLMASRAATSGRSNQPAAPIDEAQLHQYMNTHLSPHLNGILKNQQELQQVVSALASKIEAAPDAASSNRGIAERIMNGDEPYAPRG